MYGYGYTNSFSSSGGASLPFTPLTLNPQVWFDFNTFTTGVVSNGIF